MKTTATDFVPSCKECAESPHRDFSEEYFDKVRLLTSPLQLGDYKLTGDSDTHRAVEVLAHYRFEGEPATCSFPDHAGHGRGCVIVTACRRHTGNIGRFCGRKTIDNYAQLEAGLDRAEQREDQRNTLRSGPAASLAKAARIAPAVQVNARFQRGLQKFLPGLWGILKKYAPGKAVVQIPTTVRDAEGNKIEMMVPQQLFGTEIGDKLLGGGSLDPPTAELKAVVVDVAADSELRSPYRLHKRYIEAKRKIDALEKLCAGAESFFSDRNLALLLRAAELEGVRIAGIDVIQAEFRFFADGADRALGALGHRIVKKAG